METITVALAVAILTALLNWVYAKWVVLDPVAEKVFVKTLVAGLLAAAGVVLYARHQEAAPAVAGDQFFEPL